MIFSYALKDNLKIRYKNYYWNIIFSFKLILRIKSHKVSECLSHKVFE